MPIFKGTTKMKAAYKGTSSLAAIYKGSYLVWLKKFLDTISGTTPLSLPKATADPIDEANIYGMIEQRRLPSGYTEVEWIKSNKDIGLGIKTNDNMQIEAKFLRSTTSTQFVYHSDSSSSLSTTTTAYASANGVWRFGSKSTSISQNVDVIFETIQNKDGVWFNGEKVGSYTDVNTFTSSSNLCALGGASSPSNQLYYLKVKEYGSNTYDYIWIPCKRTSDNSYGLYDIVGNEFYTNSEATITAGENATPTPGNPMPIYCNNGELKVNQQGQVYADGPQETISLTHNSTTIDTASPENLLALDSYKDVQDLISGSVTRNVGIKVLDGTETYVEFSTGVFYCSDALPNAKYATNVSILCNLFVGKESGGGSSSTANYQCWLQATSAYPRLYIRHDTMNDATSFKNWVTQQYVNGTPVIIVYPLEESTTSSVTAQDLECQEGTNTVSSNKGSREMEVTYWRN